MANAGDHFDIAALRAWDNSKPPLKLAVETFYTWQLHRTKTNEGLANAPE
jgi:hypothetical protein